MNRLTPQQLNEPENFLVKATLEEFLELGRQREAGLLPSVELPEELPPGLPEGQFLLLAPLPPFSGAEPAPAEQGAPSSADSRPDSSPAPSSAVRPAP